MIYFFVSVGAIIILTAIAMLTNAISTLKKVSNTSELSNKVLVIEKKIDVLRAKIMKTKMPLGRLEIKQKLSMNFLKLKTNNINPSIQSRS